MSTLKVGLGQIAPVWLDRESTTSKICETISQAASESCSLVVFGETLLPGYPFWLGSTHGSKFDCDIQKDIHAHYLKSAVDIGRGDLLPICELAKSNNIAVMLGCYELGFDRGGHSGYCSLVYIDPAGEIRNAHRKLMPFQVSGLNCWENWMPLPRAVLHGLGSNLHVAAWPGAKRNTIDITRFVALESRSYVLSVSGLLRKSDIPDDFPHRDLVIDSFDGDMISDGGSCIAAPNGDWIIEPFCREEKLLTATLDHNEVLRERQNFDISGHYSRPDVFKLHVNRERQNLIEEMQ